MYGSFNAPVTECKKSKTIVWFDREEFSAFAEIYGETNSRPNRLRY
jgi:hypothetical protein